VPLRNERDQGPTAEGGDRDVDRVRRASEEEDLAPTGGFREDLEHV
jgi:hypothetical protein